MTDEFSGALRETVTIETWSGTPDHLGDVRANWLPAGADWAALVPIERGYGDAINPVAGEGRVSRPRFRLTLRQRSDIGLTSRFRWRGHLLAVIRLEPDPRSRDRMTLLVEQRA